jgi:hypothetical protein
VIGDEQIDAGLAPLRPVGYAKVPVEGKWRHPPFEERTVGDRLLAVLCTDPGVALPAVDRHSGEVLLIDDDGSVQQPVPGLSDPHQLPDLRKGPLGSSRSVARSRCSSDARLFTAGPGALPAGSRTTTRPCRSWRFDVPLRTAL